MAKLRVRDILLWSTRCIAGNADAAEAAIFSHGRWDGSRSLLGDERLLASDVVFKLSLPQPF
jgi:hypothetical protein